MILREFLDTNKHDYITIEYEDDEELPEEGAVLYLDGGDDDGIRIGRVVYDKYNVRTYEIVERGIEGSYNDFS